MDSHFRRSERAFVDMAAVFRELHAGDVNEGDSLGKGRVLDLSAGGAFIEFAGVIPVGTALLVAFTSPTAWDPLEIPAEVRWVKEQGFGVRFGVLSDAQSTALYELLADNPFVIDHDEAT